MESDNNWQVHVSTSIYVFILLELLHERSLGSTFQQFLGTVQENVLTEAFREYGTILSVKVVKEKGGKKPPLLFSSLLPSCMQLQQLALNTMQQHKVPWRCPGGEHTWLPGQSWRSNSLNCAIKAPCAQPTQHFTMPEMRAAGQFRS